MNATARRSIVRQTLATLRDVMALPKPFLYALLNGRAIQQMLDTGDLVTVNTVLDQLGVGADFKDGYRSHAGRHIAAAYRLTNHREPIRAWVQHRTTGKWIHPFAYIPGDESITTGLRMYPRTAHLVPVRVPSEVA